MPTASLDASIRFYRDGLELVEEWSDMGRGAILRTSADSEVELVELDAVADPPEPRTTLGLQVSPSEVDVIYRRLADASTRLKAPPHRRAWGMRGFGAFDPNGVPVNVYAASEDAEPEAETATR